MNKLIKIFDNKNTRLLKSITLATLLVFITSCGSKSDGSKNQVSTATNTTSIPTTTTPVTPPTVTISPLATIESKYACAAGKIRYRVFMQPKYHNGNGTIYGQVKLSSPAPANAKNQFGRSSTNDIIMVSEHNKQFYIALSLCSVSPFLTTTAVLKQLSYQTLYYNINVGKFYGVTATNFNLWFVNPSKTGNNNIFIEGPISFFPAI